MAGPLETYGIYCTDATLGHFGRGRMTTFFWTAFWTHPFHTFLRIFMDLAPKRVPNREPKGHQKGTQTIRIFGRFPQSAQSGSRGGQGLQKDLKIEPQGAKMEPQGLPNEGFGPQNSGEKRREFRPLSAMNQFRQRNEPY